MNTAHATSTTDRLVSLAGNLAVPDAVATVFWGLHKIHRVWRWQRRAWDIAQQSNSFHKLVAGHTLSWITGHSVLLRVCAQMVLISRRVLDCTLQAQHFSDSYGRWTEALTFRYTPPPAEWRYDAITKSWLARVLRPDRCLRIHLAWHSASLRLQRIAITTFTFLYEGFALSMRIMDLVEAFSLNTETGGEAMGELFLNSSHLINELVSHKAVMAEELVERKETIEAVLRTVGSSYTAEELSHALSKQIGSVEAVRDALEIVPDTLTAGLKDGMYTVSYALLGTAPAALLPQKQLANACTPPREEPIDDRMHSSLLPPRETTSESCRSRFYTSAV